MLRGHVDALTRQMVSGWAADDELPDETVEVSIFVDGRKLAQVACNTPRPDLLQAGAFGQSPHGFTCEYSAPLSNANDRHVSVRYASSGKLLTRGDAVIQPDNVVVVRTSLTGPADAELEQLPVPRDPRSIFEMLGLYDEKAGLYDLLSQIQFTTERPRHTHYSVFGRYPEADPSPRQLAEDDHRGNPPPRDHVNELLLSREFQRELVPLFLNAFPEKKRMVFVHVPKCAGTDLSVNLMKRFPSMHQSLMEENWTPKERLFQQVSRLVRQSRFSDSIFLCGHASLGYYASHALIRPIDRVFTVVREPIEIAISQINYILTRMARDSAGGRIGPDTREWMDILGVDALPADMSAAFIQKLRSSILYSTKLSKPNSTCSWLGGTDAESALEQLMTYDVELTTVDEYSRWLKQRWALTVDTRMNRSDSFVSLDSLGPDDISYIQRIYAEDIKLYAVISRALDRSEGASIVGEQLRGVT